jgi:GAF domain-containing protein
MAASPDLPGLSVLLVERVRAAMGGDELATALGPVIALAMEANLCDQASVTERAPGGTLVTTAPSGELVVTADRMQYVLGEGPCVAAAYGDELLTATDVATDPRWPQWGPQAASLGVCSVLSVHLYTDKDAIGALNLYSTRSRDYIDIDLDLARLIGAHVSVALAGFRGQTHLWTAIDARHNIGVAQGILMQQYRMDREQAFAVLRRVSQTEHLKLRAVADRVIRTGHLPTQAGPP